MIKFSARPWNLFMNIPVQADGQLSFESPVSQPGDYVVLRGETYSNHRLFRLSAGYGADQWGRLYTDRSAF